MKYFGVKFAISGQRFAYSIQIVTVLFLVCLINVSTGRFVDPVPRLRPQAQFISFVNEDGKVCAKEKVRVTDSEARFDVRGQRSYVLDYEQHLLVFKDASIKGAPCYLTKFDTDIIPSLEDVKKLLAENKFKIPDGRHEMSLQKSQNQPIVRPKLLPLSEIVCQNSQVVLLEEKQESADAIGAIAERTGLRPKREVGWGEVVVIIIVIIILL